MANHAEEMLQRGCALLAPLFTLYGFAFHVMESGNSSGGFFSIGVFRKENRWIELHFRYSLGLVSYHLNDLKINHQQYMQSILGKPNSSRYPGFSNDPLDGFKHLLQDLQEHGSEFLAGTDECIEERIVQANNLLPVKLGLPD